MAKALNTFVKSKMNRDLDARLVPNGEYREGRNINISKSEGADVGALENVRGNEEIVRSTLKDLQDATGPNNPLEIIGLFKHDDTSSLYLFITSWADNSSDRLSRGYRGFNFIVRIGVRNGIYTPQIMVKGSFLNFSKYNRVYGVNIIENQLYWSDNRNQPRKINIDYAFSYGLSTSQPNHQDDYYFCEDQISVAKFAPYEPIKFLKNTGGPDTSDPSDAIWEETWVNENEEWLPIFLTAPMTGLYNTNDGIQFGTITNGSNPGPQANKSAWAGNIEAHIHKGGSNTFPQVRVRNASVPNGGTFYLYDVQTAAGLTSQIVNISDNKLNPTNKVNVPSSWLAGHLITFELRNPQYQSNTVTKKEYLKDKFARFSYRFKYDNNEYSLMAPFTQPLFVPKQYGAFTEGDEAKAAVNSDLSWFLNTISSAGINITLPQLQYAFGNDTLDGLNFINRYRVKEIQILMKTSDNNNVFSIDNIELNVQMFNRAANNPLCMLVRNTYSDGYSGTAYQTNGWPYNAQFLYNYKGNKPFQVLPESDVTRVSDATPVKSLTQEVGANRVMYGNYQNSHGAPVSLNYECFVTPKLVDYNGANNPPIPASNNTTVKEYYGATLKQGRTYQVGVVLSDRYGRQSQVILANNENNTGYSDRDKSTVYAPYGLAGHNGVDGYYGDSLKISFDSQIPPNLPEVNFYPGLYDTLRDGQVVPGYNPLGWYSYKIVVKQTEQEYYNVYLPGSLSGNVVYTVPTANLTYNRIYDVTNISLFGDNINKIPKNTANLAPTDVIFNSETTLTYRVSQPVLDHQNITNNRIFSDPKAFPVVNIQQWSTFGPWTTKKGQQTAYPGAGSGNNSTDALYNVDKNPFVAAVDITPGYNTRIGFPDNIQEQGNFSRFLTIAETNPVESNLDIYWETSTTGLISDLNEAIVTGNSIDGAKGITPFLFEFQEQYPYDGVGIFPGTGVITNGELVSGTPGTGAWLLQQDLNVVQQNGQISTDPNALIQITSITSDNFGNINAATQALVGDLIDQFELVQIDTAGASGALYNSWNIRLSEAFVSQTTYVDKAAVFQFPIQGTMTFQFLVSRDPSSNAIPLTAVASATNNTITNNQPAWQYINKGNWGQSPKPDPTDVNNVLSSTNYIDPNLVMTYKNSLMSPFIPLNKSQTYGSAGSLNTKWNQGLEMGWSLSITGKEKAGNQWTTGGTNIGKMFYKGGNPRIWRVTNLSDDGNSACRMNRIIASRDGYTNTTGGVTQTGHQWRFNNGAWDFQSGSNVIPYIRRVELAKFNDDTSWNTWAASGIGDQGATPIGGWKDFLLVGTAGQNGPQKSDALSAWGYSKWPFDIAVPNTTNSPASDWSTNSQADPPTSNLCLLVDRYNPPFCQFDEWNAGKFEPNGDLGSREICVYRITIGLKELWTGGLIQTQEQVVYVKLYR